MKKLMLEDAFELEECSILELQALPGVEECRTKIEGTSAVAVLKGLALLTQEVAKVMAVPVEHVLCQITTVLLAPEIVQEVDDE